MLLAVAVLSLLLVWVHAADDEEEDKTPLLSKEYAELAKKYAGVTEWQGFFESTESGTIAWSAADSHGTKTVENSSHGHFLLKRADRFFGSDAKRGVFTWRGGDNHTVCGEQFVSSDLQQSEWDKWGVGDEWRRQASGTLPMTGTEFTIWLPTAKKSSYLVHVHGGGWLSGKTLTSTTTGHSVWDESKGDGTVVRRTRSLDATMQLQSFVDWYSPVGDAATAPWFQVVRGGPGVLVFSFESKTRADTQPSTPELIRRSRVVLSPVYDDLEVEVTIEGYTEWRPKGSIENPAKPGNNLIARATLKSKTGKMKEFPPVKYFKFQLLDTSREPGVCMNWPLEAKDEDFDLRLAATPRFPGQLSEKDQKSEINRTLKDDEGRPYAETQVDSYDFGGRTSLMVHCKLEDGREILGLMTEGGSENGVVLIPRRNSGDWIAKKWREEHNVTDLAAADDDEEIANNEFKGDGYTLYEEYRGFAVRGRHVEGDPKQKDFFILNLVGSDAWPGIRMFEAATKLRVIHRLLPTEMSQEYRLMNGNHRDAPHRIDQHGVWMAAYGWKEIGHHGAQAVIRNKHASWRPGNTSGIGVPKRDDPTSDFNQPFNLTADSIPNSYDRAIAHELAHSVGAFHHGVGDDRCKIRYLPADDSRSGGTAGLFAIAGESLIRVQVLSENGEPVIDRMAPGLERRLAELRAKSQEEASAGGAARRVVDQLPVYDLYVGMAHGQHSGNDQCLLRYDFANLYIMDPSSRNVFYFIEPGTEPGGTILCSNANGTGVNDALTHKPQSRYFDANPGVLGGSCFEKICPNDATPAPVPPVPPEPPEGSAK